MIYDRIFELASPVRGLPLFLRYLIATAVVLVFFGLRSASGPLLDNYPFLLFFPAIIAISLILDRGTGVFAVLLSAGLAWYFFIPNYNSFVLAEPRQAIPLAIYVVVGLFLTVSLEALRQAARALKDNHAALERSARLNELLLVDINHRVKNHLLSVTALLRLSQKQVTDLKAREALDEAAGRISVLGKVYTRLHLGEHATVVRSKDFLDSLCDDLRAGVVAQRPIALRTDMEDVDLASSQAVPLGLIVNELLENALKYAFPDERPGVITVKFARDGEHYCLSVADDGVGRPVDAAPGGGTRLIRSLAQQLGGTLREGGPPGTRVEVAFPLQPPGA
jgi:two-component system, sensor histidine kinase PdtaS